MTTPRSGGPVLITGGAGFIGANLADRLAADGRTVRLYDNLARPGVEANLEWLRARRSNLVEFVRGDVRDADALRRASFDASAVYHFAAQVAVTTSVERPGEDFETNLRGTFNLLEALRALEAPPPLFYTSTNKVYGALAGVELEELASRYAPRDAALARWGVAEDQPLDLYSPYGCSKGGADQYVLDYARVYGLPAVVFRMSCVYGPRQFGTEDQGWVAHFLISALRGRPITVYGNGKQVRDVLYVDDLLDAFALAEANVGGLQGHAFNIGGGPDAAVSLREMLQRISALTGRALRLQRGTTRPGDQPWYVSDIHKFAAATGWRPKVGPAEGVERLHRWLEARIPSPATSMQGHEVRAGQSQLEL